MSGGVPSIFRREHAVRDRRDMAHRRAERRRVARCRKHGHVLPVLGGRWCDRCGRAISALSSSDPS